MGRRKNYPWNSRAEKQMTNLVSGLLAGLIVAPFAIMDSVPNNTNNLNTEPVSKPVAIIFLIFGIALTPLFIPLISLAFELFDFLEQNINEMGFEIKEYIQNPATDYRVKKA